MGFDYDEYGYLISGEPIEVALETFALEFVVNEHRTAIFSEYKLFVSELVELIVEWRFLFSTDRRKRGKGFVQIKF
jgi:hypothetical protein